MIERIDCTVKRTFEYYGFSFHKNDNIVFLNEERRIQNKTGKFALKLHESITPYDLYVNWLTTGYLK